MSYEKFSDLFESASTKNEANSRSLNASNPEPIPPEYYTKDAPMGVVSINYDRLKELRDAPNNASNNAPNNAPNTASVDNNVVTKSPAEESVCSSCCTLI